MIIQFPENISTRSQQMKFVTGHSDLIIQAKKAEVKSGHNIEILPSFEVNKALTTSFKDDIMSGMIKRTIIGNTYNYMDSHKDVHIPGIFKKSIEERSGKINHFADHKNQVTARVGKFEKVYEKEVSWEDLGTKYPGKTTALFGDSNIYKDYNPSVFKQYLEGDIDQHSVGMIYLQVEYMVDDKSDPFGYDRWVKYRPIIANGEKADEAGYAFIVKEAKLIEISAVTQGSNDITQTVPNSFQPGSPTEDESEKSTQKSLESVFLGF